MLSTNLRRVIKITSVSFLTVLVAGCASAYIAPNTDEPSASISFEIEGDPIFGYLASFFYFEERDDRSCMSPLQRMALINEGNPFAGKSTNTKDIRIPAGRTIIIRSMFSPANAFSQRTCKADNYINAEADNNYTLRVKWLANRCDFNFFDTTSGEDIPIRVKSEPSACR